MDASSVQSKESRLEVSASLHDSEHISNESLKNSSSLPKSELPIHVSPAISLSPLTPRVSSSPTCVISIPAWHSPRQISADVSHVSHALREDSKVASLYVVPVSMQQELQAPGSQFVDSRNKQNTVSGSSTLMTASDGSFVPLSMPNPPTNSVPCRFPCLHASRVMPSQISSERFQCTSTTSEVSCSSLSQLPGCNLPYLSPCISSSTSSTMNRQPVCLTARSSSKVGKMKNDQKTIKHRVLKYHRARLASLKLKHEVDLKEKFFLATGSNMMDIVTWKKRPNLKRDEYLKLYDIECETLPFIQHALSPNFHKLSSSPDIEPVCSNDVALCKQDRHSKQLKIKAEGESSSVTSTTVQIPLSTVSRSIRSITPSPMKTSQVPKSSPRPITRLHSSFSSFYETSHEDIVMRARHEAEVMRAIGELREEGLWSSSRLPKVQEPVCKKVHWDYLLEEMQWLAADFANERRWKTNAARKISRSVNGYYRELEMQQSRIEKEEAIKLRKIALSIAKEIKHFWNSVQKIVVHKQQLLLEEKKKRAMDMHLEFIVDQTAKYSSWLVKGLTTSSATTPSEPSLHSAAASDEDAFLTPEETSDDEETIENEEQLMENEDGIPNYASEIKTLQEEGELPLEKLLATLPTELLMSDSLVTVTDEIKEEMTRGYSRASRFVGENASNAERVDTTLGIEKDNLKESIIDVDGEAYDICKDSKNRGASSEQDKVTSIQAQSETTENEEDRKEDNIYEDKNHIELPEKGSMEYTCISSEDSGEYDSETSFVEDENENIEGLKYLVSREKIEEECQMEAGFSNAAAVAEQFQPKGITLATTEVKTKIPFLLKHSLREYQHIGLDWLVAMHEKRLNGILADEMGLGKTIQTIALLAHLACEEGNWGPHLIVVPTSVMLNWECELKKWCPAFKLLTYFGPFKERKQKRIGWTKRNAFHVCITSYNIAVTDHRAFKQMKWKYLILDEAQNIKNFKSQRWQTLLTFNSQRRLLLTGTPLQNNLMELWSLMHFLVPSVFSSHSDFREWFSNPLTGMVEGSQEYNDSVVKRLHQVLRPFLLRRLKAEVEKQMPKKYEHVILCRLSKRQRFLYDEYMSRRKTKDTLATGNYLSVINILMQLRKVCNHPDLFEPRPIVSPLRLTALEYYTASLLFTVFEHNPFCHVCLDHLNLQLASYELNTEAFTAFRSRQLQAPKAMICDPVCSQLGDKDTEENERAGRLLLDLHLPYLACNRLEWSLSRRRHIHEVNSWRCRRTPIYGIDLVKVVKSMSEFKSKQVGMHLSQSTFRWLWSGYMACKRQLVCKCGWEELLAMLQAIVLSNEQKASMQKEMLKRFVITVPSVTAPSVTLHTRRRTPACLNHDTQLVGRIVLYFAPRSSMLHCASTCMSLQFPETRLIQYDCGKLQTLDVLLRSLKAGNHRVLIFTQMARVLDTLEIFLNYHGHTYLRLDGATAVQKRQVLMDQFNRDERVFCFILSTRSGGLGVNLTGADTVVFYDSDWNPTMDAQAQDRCHRIGQTRDVHIYRLVCEGTVEENILKKANQKRILGDIAIEGGVFTTDFFREANLKDLFQVKSDMQSSRAAFNPESETEDVPLSSNSIEDLLMQAEDESDAQAASIARAEQVADSAEFDEDFCALVDGEYTSETQSSLENNTKISIELGAIEHHLSGVERYAVRYLEEESADTAAEQLQIAEENIRLAKKSWELSHMQSLIVEERVAEKDAEDDIILSYDRPELTNKVILRRHSSTGMWEVCSPNKSTQRSNETKSSVSLKDANSSDSEGSCSRKQVPVSHLSDLQSRRNQFAQKDELAIARSVNHLNLRERSPRLLRHDSHIIHLQEQQCCKATVVKNLEFNHRLLLEKNASDGDSIVNCSQSSKRKTIDRDLISSQVTFSSAHAYLFARSQSSDHFIGSNEIVASSAQGDRVEVRTRPRDKNQVVSTSGSSISSPQSLEGSTVSH